MPSFHDLLQETKRGSVYDLIRREWLAKLAKFTERNVIADYLHEMFG